MGSELIKIITPKKQYSAPLVDQNGSTIGNVDLNPEVFGFEPNVSLLHQVVTAQLAAARRGTQSTKTRAEVRGGGAKPFRQKGTGRARQGSIRAPHWSGGGVALGPKPRDYEQKTPKKMKRAALFHSLSDRASAEGIIVVDSFNYDEPKTRTGLSFLTTANLLDKKVLMVVNPFDYNLVKTFSNVVSVRLIDKAELNPYDVLWSDVVVFDKATLPGVEIDEDDDSEINPMVEVEVGQ